MLLDAAIFVYRKNSQKYLTQWEQVYEKAMDKLRNVVNFVSINFVMCPESCVFARRDTAKTSNVA